jgi:hypothetical protein
MTLATRPLRHVGYFVGMLSYEPEPGLFIYNRTFMSQELQDFDSTDARAINDTLFVRIDGTAGDDKRVVELNAGEGTWTGTQPMQRTELGYNAYMEWGSWTQPMAMDTGGEIFYFDNKGYYVWGDVTTDAQMAALRAANLVAVYSGSAYGTYWTSTGGADMTGSFGTTVNFGTGELSGFGFNVSGGGHSASLVGGTGAFIGGTSQFLINDGIWTIVESGDASGTATGSVYGDQAQAIGGVWSMDGEGSHASGIFQGTR